MKYFQEKLTKGYLNDSYLLLAFTLLLFFSYQPVTYNKVIRYKNKYDVKQDSFDWKAIKIKTKYHRQCDVFSYQQHLCANGRVLAKYTPLELTK